MEILQCKENQVTQGETPALSKGLGKKVLRVEPAAEGFSRFDVFSQL